MKTPACYDMLNELRRLPHVSGFIASVIREPFQDVIEIHLNCNGVLIEQKEIVISPNQIDPTEQIQQLDALMRSRISEASLR